MLCYLQTYLSFLHRKQGARRTGKLDAKHDGFDSVDMHCVEEAPLSGTDFNANPLQKSVDDVSKKSLVAETPPIVAIIQEEKEHNTIFYVLFHPVLNQSPEKN